VFLLGGLLGDAPNNSNKLALLGIHMTLGIITLLVMVARFFVHQREIKPAPVTAGNVFLDKVGKLTHYGLYILVIFMSLAGIGISLQAGLAPIVFGGSGAPLPTDFYVYSMRTVHGIIAPVLVLLLMLHIGAALYHQFMLKDNLIARMWYER